MRELEFQLSKKDILHMMLDARYKKGGIKESKVLIMMLLIIGITLFSTAGIVLYSSQGPFLFVWLMEVCSGIGLLLSIAAIIAIFLKAVQYIRVVKSPRMLRQTVRFGEHRIEICSKDCVNCYPYASILYVEKTKHQILIYVKQIGEIKDVLALPESAFTDEFEMDCCLAFLEEKQQKEAFMDPPDQQSQIMNPEKQTYSFAFILEESEWLEVLSAGKAYRMRSGYIFKTSGGIIMIVLALFIGGLQLMPFIWEGKVVTAVATVILLLLLFGTVYGLLCSRRVNCCIAKRELKRGRIVPDRTGRQVITFDRSGISLCTDREQQSITYSMIHRAVESRNDLFIFTKGQYFFNIPDWVFKTEKEKL